MRKLAIAVAVLLVLLVGVDIVTRMWVQEKMASVISHDVPGVRKVRASISSFPFLGRLALQGQVSHVTIDLQGVTLEPVELTDLRASVDGFTMDRGDLLDGHITVTKVAKVDVRAVFSDADLTKAAGVPVSVASDGVRATSGGRSIAVHVAVVGRDLRLSGGGASVTVPIPDSDYLPCSPAVTTGEGEVSLECTSDHLPPVVVRAIGSATLRKG
jgi:hypothetical protein